MVLYGWYGNPLWYKRYIVNLIHFWRRRITDIEQQQVISDNGPGFQCMMATTSAKAWWSHPFQVDTKRLFTGYIAYKARHCADFILLWECYMKFVAINSLCVLDIPALVEVCGMANVFVGVSLLLFLCVSVFSFYLVLLLTFVAG